MTYYRIRNWQDLQHYKDRSPPWIKLHRSVIDDYQFSCLPDGLKAALMLLWLYASQNDGRIPHNPKFLARKLCLSREVDLARLVRGGFLVPEQDTEDAEALPAPRYQAAGTVLREVQEPARPGEESRKRKEEEESRAVARGRAVPRPPDFLPSKEHVELADQLRLASLKSQFAKFCDYHDSKGSTFTDWDAALRSWLRKAGDWPSAKLHPEDIMAIGSPF
jgi:hypothetical protein